MHGGQLGQPIGDMGKEGFVGAEAADAVLDVTGGDVNDELLAVGDTVARIIGAPGRPFRQWVEENAAAFR